ncbi:MAG: hypothetical protein ABUS57_15695 [Pseudomonadota bacterium]
MVILLPLSLASYHYMAEGQNGFERRDGNFRSVSMRSVKTALGAAAFMIAGLAGAGAQQAVPADMINAAKAIQAGCVKKGEDSRVCACGVGLAYAQLDPKAFKLVPQVEPMLDQKNQFAAMAGLVQLASASGMSVTDLQTAYDTIKANRAVVKQVCKPLAPGTK